MALHTMLVYRNRQFGTYMVQTGMCSLRMAVAGGQLSYSIFAFSCTDIAVHGLTMYSSWHTLMYAFLKKCYRKADHLTQPFLGSTYLSEPCMYRIANSCTLALYVGPWRWYRRVWMPCHKEIQGSWYETGWTRINHVQTSIYLVQTWLYLVQTMIRRDHKCGILHTEIQHISVHTHTNYGIQRISEYIL